MKEDTKALKKRVKELEKNVDELYTALFFMNLCMKDTLAEMKKMEKEITELRENAVPEIKLVIKAKDEEEPSAREDVESAFKKEFEKTCSGNAEQNFVRHVNMGSPVTRSARMKRHSIEEVLENAKTLENEKKKPTTRKEKVQKNEEKK